MGTHTRMVVTTRLLLTNDIGLAIGLAIGWYFREYDKPSSLFQCPTCHPPYIYVIRLGSMTTDRSTNTFA